MDAREVAQTHTEFLPDSNECLIRYFGADGALLSEQRITADVIEQFNNIHVPQIEYDMNGMRRYTLTESEYQRYLDMTRDSAERYLDITYGTRTEPREDFLRTRSRHLYEIFLKGEWKIPEEEEQPDIQEERGGALDEFLEKFTPQKITPERSDEQK